ncbi:MAG: hypothetical protein IT193_00360 [Propionibacteriaceae bacterium]|nr:hypothetical protein [Propionibacteriaceae bacterium]
MAAGEWYYCLDHHLVEPYEACRSETRLGPYATPAEAAQALEKVASRNTDWDNDPRFNDPDEEGEEEEPEGWGPFRH